MIQAIFFKWLYLKKVWEMGMICGFMERKILYLFQEIGNNLPKTEKKHLQQGFVNAITIKIYRS